MIVITIIKENKTVSSIEPMHVEFGLNINGKRGVYLLETDNSQIIHERLEFTITKRKGIYFDIIPSISLLMKKSF